MKLLNLTQAERLNCHVCYMFNRFEVYHNDGWMITAARTVTDLKKQLSDNGIVNPIFGSIAQQKYIGV